MRVLLVEDEAAIARDVASALAETGYVVDIARDGEEGWFRASTEDYDAIVLDLGLPKLDGLSVVRRLREEDSTVPILVLTARGAWLQRVEGIDAGADDYLTKPFGMDELLARVRAALRRGQPAGSQPVVVTQDFTVDLAAKRVTTDAGPIRLTPTEWHLLDLLIRHTGKLVSRQQLLSEVWGPAYVKETNYLRVYMSQLRQKLEADPSHPRHIITEPGMGYRFEL